MSNNTLQLQSYSRLLCGSTTIRLLLILIQRYNIQKPVESQIFFLCLPSLYTDQHYIVFLYSYLHKIIFSYRSAILLYYFIFYLHKRLYCIVLRRLSVTNSQNILENPFVQRMILSRCASEGEILSIPIIAKDWANIIDLWRIYFVLQHLSNLNNIFVISFLPFFS